MNTINWPWKSPRAALLETTLGGQRQLNRGLAVTRTVCNWQLATASCRGIGMLTAIEELLDKRIGRCRLYLFSLPANRDQRSELNSPIKALIVD
eukprot:1021460-Amphidinium_carterae.2